jgi:MerR family copper efflux transcriptional regulator
MNIGELAAQAAITAKTIRYYEDIGLIPAATRSANGYRVYTEQDVRLLRFIHRARDLGFSLEEIGDLLDLWGNTRRASADVKALALRHIAAIDRKLAEMQSLRGTIDRLTRQCRGDSRPDCPILDDLSHATGTASPASPAESLSGPRPRRVMRGANGHKAVRRAII